MDRRPSAAATPKGVPPPQAQGRGPSSRGRSGALPRSGPRFGTVDLGTSVGSQGARSLPPRPNLARDRRATSVTCELASTHFLQATRLRWVSSVTCASEPYPVNPSKGYHRKRRSFKGSITHARFKSRPSTRALNPEERNPPLPSDRTQADEPINYQPLYQFKKVTLEAEETATASQKGKDDAHRNSCICEHPSKV
ncbi:hypothetical protein L0F63_000140 [Massospora cicadina]|nr:hypothetical protein L0F63_000140 [Massospora cicadina]